jgi:cell division protein FtsN
MRIDYSEPKQSYVGGQNKPRPRKEPGGLVAMAVVGTAVVTFVAGFGTGWYFSQQSAKKAFQAAMEQRSLENSAQPATTAVQAPKPEQPAPSAEAAVHQAQPGGAQALPAAQTVPEPNLSFYKTLPSGQKNNVIGSGINAADNGKKPLQAAIPSNLRQVQSEPAPPAPPSPERAASKSRDNGFVVQVASYSLKSEAESVRNKLAGKGLNVSIVESNQGDKGIWYRVRVGQRLEQEAAKELAAKLGKGAIVIPDND